MSSEINTISPADQCICQVQNRSYENFEIIWIGFDKFHKLIYGVVHSGEKLQLVAQSVFGGDAVIVQQIVLRCINLRRLIIVAGTLHDEKVAVIVQSCSLRFYLFSLNNGTVEKYDLITKSFILPDLGCLIDLYYSSHIGYFGPIYNELSNGDLYRFIFNNDAKTFKAELVTNCTDWLFSSGFTANEKNFFNIEYMGKEILNVYDLQQKFWYEKILCNAPKNGKLVDLVVSNENTIALFCLEVSENRPILDEESRRVYVLYKLIDDSWEDCRITYFSPSEYLNKMLSKNGVVFIPGDKGPGNFVNINVLSLQDCAMRKMLSCWKNNNISFKRFVELLNLPTLMKRQYFAL